MLHSVTGDIQFTTAQAIAHGIAPNDDFKSGLAKEFHEHYPALVKDYRHFCHTAKPKPGTLWMWGGVNATGRSIRIINLLTQEPGVHSGAHAGKAHLEYVNHALHALRKLIDAKEFNSLALPRIATGVGGLNWSDVEPVIKRVLGDAKIPIFVYSTYKKGVTADEQL